MNMNTLRIIGLLIAAGSLTAYGQRGPSQRQGGPGGGGPGRPAPKEIAEKFDKDGDGQLSEEERKTMHEQMGARRGGPEGQRPSREEMLKRFDTDGDGELNDEERAAMEAAREERQAKREDRQKEMLERFDADGDGQLSKEERKTMRETLGSEKPQEPPAEKSAE